MPAHRLYTDRAKGRVARLAACLERLAEAEAGLVLLLVEVRAEQGRCRRVHAAALAGLETAATGGRPCRGRGCGVVPLATKKTERRDPEEED